MANTYLEAIEQIAKYYGATDEWARAAVEAGLDIADAEAKLSRLPNVDVIKNADGTLRGYAWKTSPQLDPNAVTTINSNIPTGTPSTVNIPAEMGTEAGKLTMKSGLANAGQFIFKDVVPAVAAAGVGITLGKTIDSLLYNANPDFWDAHGMSALNPETWGSITRDNSSIGATAFNMIFGIDPETGKSQGYIDETALAYIAAYMQSKGAFDEGSGGEIKPVPIPGVTLPSYVPTNAQFVTGTNAYLVQNPRLSNRYHHITTDIPVYLFLITDLGVSGARNYNIFVAVSETPFKYGHGITPNTTTAPVTDATAVTLGGHTFYYTSSLGTSAEAQLDTSTIPCNIATGALPGNQTQRNNDLKAIAYYILYGSEVIEPVPGIGTQPGATTPQLSDDMTIAEVLEALREQYPALFADTVENTVIKSDGTERVYTYVKVVLPDAKSDTDTQPVSGTATQSDTEIDPETAPESLLELLARFFSEPTTNPAETGSGNTPPVVIPPGTASALFKIYNPTQAQLNSFGGWLWSSNFVDQLLKLFNDPMQAIIGLHKVYAAPPLGSVENIHVGYLDSGVSSNTVTGQYVTVECGTVDLVEQSQNVFDYDPYTDVSMYLPFIGIVRLNTADVMRGKIKVTYRVDVLTGACLAQITVTRDNGAGGVLYEYSGNAAVQYPVSSGSYMGIVTGLISAAGALAGGAALAPVAVGALSGARTKVERSGSLTGNAGAMGSKKPYLIISRAQSVIADNFPKLQGAPDNRYMLLGDITGYAEVRALHLEGINATRGELDEIDSLLKSGVIVKTPSNISG